MRKVLIVHNRYIHAGGEDEVVAAESAMLRSNGHEVIEYIDDNERIRDAGRLGLAANTLWSRSTFHRLLALLSQERPDIAHFHNTFPLISPAAYYACHKAGVPVVQTLHNYRLICPNALFLRNGKTCELCLGRTPPWPGVIHACYRRSRIATAVVAGMLTFHRFMQTWSRKVDAFVALTNFSRETFLRAGFSEAQVHVKPNFFHPDVGPGDGAEGSVLFVGRLSEDKGLDTLLETWRRYQIPRPLKIVGDGPLAHRIASSVGEPHNIHWLGRRSRGEVVDLMKGSALLVVPSLAYEGFPLILAEAFCAGLPIVASGHGALAEIVRDGYAGLHFRTGDPADLAAKVNGLLNRPENIRRMRRASRSEYELKYTADLNYHQLIGIYERADTTYRSRAAARRSAIGGSADNASAHR
jgi:glycosyltransferase involved in cell wall biosynthesis